MSGVTQLKLDVTTLRKTEENTVPVILNFNIPASVVEDNVPQTFDQVLNNIAEFLVKHFHTRDVIFQVTASYYLEHAETGDRRLWTGSFYPVGNHSSSLSGPIFQAFQNSPSFVRRVKEFSLPQNIAACLRWGGEESNWRFESLASIITSAQVGLHENHVFLSANDLLLNRRGHQRRHVTKLYPF